MKKIRKATANEIIEFVKEKWNTQKCPMCENNKWEVSESCFGLAGFDKDNLIYGGENCPLMPMIALICNNCGNIIFINPLSVGLLKEK